MEQTNIPQRRVGTATAGAVLVIMGLGMLYTMFFPQAEMTLLLRLSPLMLVSLGAETLLAARGGGKVRYDWVGMLLSMLLVGTALVLYAIGWCIVYHPEWIDF